MDMMKTVDGGVHECDESDDVARGVLGRLENMVLAPRGETGSFTQMPSITHLYPHQPAKSSVSHTNVPPQSSVSDPCFWISSLSSLNKLLLPGTCTLVRLFMPTHSFIDCGADDVFMDAELADRLNIPLVKIPVPIKLRLADGDSSSMITHRTLPLQLHIGRHVETIGLGKPPRTSDISPKPSIPEQESSDKASDSAADLDIDLSLFKDPSMDLDLGCQTTSNSVFKRISESQADILPSHRSFDCTINLSSSAEPSYGRIYQLTREEDKVMQEWIADNLAKGFIRNSSSPYGAPCFFVKQKDKLRLCMDYRGLNKQTIKDRNPIPLISEMLRTLSTGKIFTTLDLRGAYNLLRIKEGDEPKTAFITKYGQFEFLVMPFGLANAPAQFQRMMNSLFRHMINKIKYLGYIISPDGTSMDPSKISAVQDWPAPKKVRELQVFLGFTNFYRALVSGYSDITCHLTKLLKKDVPFSWGPGARNLRLKS
ncbi:hypothetical protein BASA83_010189 [Batrachochytrium salamandrivorans]|nr:hypothetical protein BASA83_010189 [Batrachochytrium salamandrivorans]